MEQVPSILDSIATLRRERQRQYEALVARIADGGGGKDDNAPTIDRFLRESGIAFSQFCEDVCKGKASDCVSIEHVLSGVLQRNQRRLREQRNAAQIERENCEHRLASLRAELSDIQDGRRRLENSIVEKQAVERLKQAIASAESVIFDAGKSAGDLDAAIDDADRRLGAVLAG